MQANHRIISEDELSIIITDTGSRPSIADAPDGVIKDLLAKNKLRERQVIFQDDAGVPCVMLVENGALSGFELLSLEGKDEPSDSDEDEPHLVDIGPTVDGILETLERQKLPIDGVIASIATVVLLLEETLAKHGEEANVMEMLNLFHKNAVEVRLDKE